MAGCIRLADYTKDLEVTSSYPRHLLIFTQDPLPDTLLQEGVHVITLTVTDPAGHTVTCTKILHVECQPTFYNTEQTATCPAGQTGSPVTIAAGLYSGATQAAADAAALAAAEAALVCVVNCAAFCNTPQTAECIPPFFGDPVTVGAGLICAESQERADAQALAVAESLLNCHLITDNRLVYYRFEVAGEDTGGNGYDLIDNPGATFLTPGKIGNGLRFDISGYARRLGTPGLAYNGGGLTLCGWIKRESDGFFSDTITLGYSWGNFQLCILWFPAAVINFTWGNIGVDEINQTFVSGNLWTFFRAWHDPADNKFRLQTSQTNSLGPIGVSPTPYVPAGGALTGDITIQCGAAAHGFLVDELALYNRALSDAEAAYIFNAGAGRILVP